MRVIKVTSREIAALKNENGRTDSMLEQQVYFASGFEINHQPLMKYA